MARGQDVELQETFLGELPAVVQRFVPRPQERRGVLGQAEGEQPLLNLLDGLTRLQHDASVSPLEHQEEHQKHRVLQLRTVITTGQPGFGWRLAWR